MRQLSFEIIIAMPRTQVWDKLRDLLIARHYVPGATSIEFNTAQHEGVGASRKVFMKGRAPVDETVVVWEEGRGFTIKLHNGDKPAAPFKRATFQYELADAPDGQTFLKGVIAYEVLWGFFGRALDVFVLKSAMQRSNETLGSNIKTFYETGQTTNSDLA